MSKHGPLLRMDYLRFYHLRVYDRINAPMSMHLVL